MDISHSEIRAGYQLIRYALNESLGITIAFDPAYTPLPANGGLRFSHYESHAAQDEEALILAQQMTKKHRLYNTGFAGVKLVANGANTPDNKIKILNAVADILNRFQGKIYTGCDININNQDMTYLTTLTPYVLSGLESQIDTSYATAYGVYASVKAMMQHYPTRQNNTLMVHGIGKLGRVLVTQLIKDGHTVYSYDINSDAAEINGAINMSAQDNWFETKCDYLLLCSHSGVITEEIAHNLNCTYLISGANAPFASEHVVTILKEKNIIWLPDVISNSGAVICDVLEYTQKEKYRSIDPQNAYTFIYNAIFDKASKILSLTKKYPLRPDQILDIFFTTEQHEPILNADFMN